MKTFSSYSEMAAMRAEFRYVAFVSSTEAYYTCNNLRELCSYAYQVLKATQLSTDLTKDWSVYRASDGQMITMGYWSDVLGRYFRIRHITNTPCPLFG